MRKDKYTFTMVGFMIFVIIVLAIVFFNIPDAAGFHKGCVAPTIYMSNEGFDDLTKTNTNANSTTAITSTKMQHLLRGKSTDIIDNKMLISKKPVPSVLPNKKIKFNNNVKVRVFDVKTREIIGNGRKRL